MKLVYIARYTFFIILFIFSNACIGAQVSLIRGKTVDSVTGKNVEYAFIQNYSLGKNSYSNADGDFNLDARIGDTLVLYALGYYYQKFIVTDDMLRAQHTAAFPLNQQPVELSEARIVGVGTYNDFKREFIQLDKPRTKTDELNDYIAAVSHIAARESYDKAEAARRSEGVTLASVPILTPDEKERIKLAGIIKKEQVQDQVYQKFNPHVVKSVTGLSDDNQIIEFMIYCHFTDKYLLEVNDYDLSTRIALKFEMFKRKKLDEKSMENPLNRLADRLNDLA
jgi:hypothetical protein